MSIFKDKTLLITGGTGSFGNMVLKRFLESDIKEIRIFSRDEKKQDDMRHHLQAAYPEASKKVKFYIGDVRDRQSIDIAMRGMCWSLLLHMVLKILSFFLRIKLHILSMLWVSPKL